MRPRQGAIAHTSRRKKSVARRDGRTSFSAFAGSMLLRAPLLCCGSLLGHKGEPSQRLQAQDLSGDERIRPLESRPDGGAAVT
jgi:hypothetical protein